ncbi:hypothetical protein V0R39_26505 [Pseudomonas inefficax]|nr:hypothetical protein [Pseudomonas inefficax]
MKASLLKASLPDYMVPAHLLFLAKLPLTANGKLDRRALPQPDASLLQAEYVAPQSELEQQIAAIWADVLKLERVGLEIERRPRGASQHKAAPTSVSGQLFLHPWRAAPWGPPRYHVGQTRRSRALAQALLARNRCRSSLVLRSGHQSISITYPNF